MLTSLVRSSHSSILQELPYTPSLSFHDPGCVVVEPEPTNVETLELYAQAAYPDFDKVLAPAFADPRIDHLLTALYHLLVHEGENVALVTNHGQIIDIALVHRRAAVRPDGAGRSFGVLGQRTDPRGDRRPVQRPGLAHGDHTPGVQRAGAAGAAVAAPVPT